MMKDRFNRLPPFTYGYTATTFKPSEAECPKKEVPRQANNINHSPDPCSGSDAHHSESPGVRTPPTKNSKDELNFGWFSLPHSNKAFAAGEEQPVRPNPTSGMSTDPLACPTAGQLAPTEESYSQNQTHPMPPQWAPESSLEVGAGPRQSSRHDSPVPTQTPSVAALDQGLGSVCAPSRLVHVQPPGDGDTAINWPLSALARENLTRPSTLLVRPAAQTNTDLPSKVPMTPPPPLQWQGYQNLARPTFASWHDSWHMTQQPPPVERRRDSSQQREPILPTVRGKPPVGGQGQSKFLVNRGRGSRTNASNSYQAKESRVGVAPGTKSRSLSCSGAASKARGTPLNININNSCSSSSNSLSNNNNSEEEQLLQSTSQVPDGNNNNWGIAETAMLPSRDAPFRTLPSYGPSASQGMLAFYNPDVVMKWDDSPSDLSSSSTNQSSSQQSHSRLTRLRSALMNLWSRLSCVRGQQSEVTEEEPDYFRYGRLDDSWNEQAAGHLE